ncbi:MAG: DMT family transporter [Beijerinckiaceae bacterium]
MAAAPVHPHPTAQDNRRGILSMLAASFVFVIGDTLVRLTAATLPTGEIMVLRGLISISLVLLIMAFTGTLRDMRGIAKPVVLARSVVESLITASFITALPHLPLADVTSIVSAAPLVMTAIIVILGLEIVGWRRWLAIIVGFVGVLFVMQPSAQGIGWPALMLLGCTILIAVRDLITRQAGAGISTMTMTLGTTVSVTVVGLIMGWFEKWTMPGATESTWIICAAVLVAAGNFFIIRAMRGTDVSVVMPFRYASILNSTVLGFFVWQELPNGWAIIGAGLIISSGIYTIWRERVRALEAKAREKAGEKALTA